MLSDELTERLTEAIATWRLRLGDSRAILGRAATDLLAAGDVRASVVELASLYSDDSAYAVDAVIERLVDELDLHGALSTDLAVLAARQVCRDTISGAMSERQLADWAHQYFQHQSGVRLIDELAILDDDYDVLEWTGDTVDSLNARVREVARSILQLGDRETL